MGEGERWTKGPNMQAWHVSERVRVGLAWVAAGASEIGSGADAAYLPGGKFK